MTGQEETTADVLRSVWATTTHDHPLDEDCSPNKACRNMKDVTFDGYAEPGTDIGAAWRAKLAREGKLTTSGGSVRDLVLGQGE
ncbi:MAG TPA: hypothetical protein VI193_04565 [Acidimicrobiia bacterium]